MKYKIEYNQPKLVSNSFYIRSLDIEKIKDFVTLYLKGVKNTINISMPYSDLGLTIPCIVDDVLLENDKIYFIVDSSRRLTECRVILDISLSLDKSNGSHDDMDRIPLDVNNISYIRLLDVSGVNSITDDKLSSVEAL